MLLALAKQGGFHSETRVSHWLEIARTTVDQFGGSLESIRLEPYAKAKKALKLFPAIGDPGAGKILLFCSAGHGLPLDSNGSRVLLHVGCGRANSKNYAAQYRSIQEAIAADLPPEAGSLARAHLLLRQHGKEICRDRDPCCHECPIVAMCEYAASPGL